MRVFVQPDARGAVGAASSGERMQARLQVCTVLCCVAGEAQVVNCKRIPSSRAEFCDVSDGAS